MQKIQVAVCISGQIRGTPKRNLDNLKHNFPSADIFLGTWKGTQTDYPVKFYEEPQINYHPYGDLDESLVLSDRLAHKIPRFMSQPHEVKRTSHQTKQILAHAYMVDDNPGYDVYVRARWDTLTYLKADFQKYVEDAYSNKRAIGFGAPGTPFTQIQEASTGPFHDYFLFDQLIIHSAEVFNTDLVYTLNEEKKLIAAEWGWYQVMSQPYNNNHRCMMGWANPESHVTG